MAELLIWPTGRTGDEGRPTVAIQTTCLHATVTTEYEAAVPTLVPEERGRLIGSASQLHDQQLPCACFRNGARIRIGMPEEWQREGIGPAHHRYVDA
jgi:hypothetical protein